MSRRIVITGMGVITSLGETVDEMWEALCAGKSGIKTVTRWDFSKFPVRFGGECIHEVVVVRRVVVEQAEMLDVGFLGQANSAQPRRVAPTDP